MSKKEIKSKEFEAIENVNTSSVGIKRTAKAGQGVSLSVKIYNENPQEATKEAQKIFDDLNKKYKSIGE